MQILHYYTHVKIHFLQEQLYVYMVPEDLTFWLLIILRLLFEGIRLPHLIQQHPVPAYIQYIHFCNYLHNYTTMIDPGHYDQLFDHDGLFVRLISNIQCTHMYTANWEGFVVLILQLIGVLDGTRESSKDQLKGKQLSPMSWPDPLIVFRAKVTCSGTTFLKISL